MLRFLLTALLFVPAFPAAADIQVNAYTPGDQEDAAVAMARDGSFVVVWTSLGSAGTDQASFSVQARRFDLSGVPRGGDFQVHTTIEGSQRHADVDVDETGNILVVWASGSDVLGRWFDAEGRPLTGEVAVGGDEPAKRGRPAVAMTADGLALVVWEVEGDDPRRGGLEGRLFSAPGVPSGSAFRIDAQRLGKSRHPRIARIAGGGFVVVWEKPADTGNSIWARLVDSDGTLPSAEILVGGATGFPAAPAVASEMDGTFLVTWANQLGIVGRSMSRDGRQGGKVFYVSDAPKLRLPATTSGPRRSRWRQPTPPPPPATPRPGLAPTRKNSIVGDFFRPVVTSLGADRFTIVWDGELPLPPHMRHEGLLLRRLDGNLKEAISPDSPEEWVTVDSDSTQHDADVASNAEGDLVIVWTGQGPEDEMGIRARVFRTADRFFSDGFESGDTSGWATVAVAQELSPKEKRRAEKQRKKAEKKRKKAEKQRKNAEKKAETKAETEAEKKAEKKAETEDG